jgi:hypothetical protein
VTSANPLTTAGVSDTAELRPSLTKPKSRDTEDCYRRRVAHYQVWCDRIAKEQPGVEHITTAKVEAFVAEQIRRWETEDPKKPQDQFYRRLVPDTMLQAINALVDVAERAGLPVPNDREAKEMVKRFRVKYNREHRKLWKVESRGNIAKQTFEGSTHVDVMRSVTAWMRKAEAASVLAITSMKVAYVEDEAGNPDQVSVVLRYTATAKG